MLKRIAGWAATAALLAPVAKPRRADIDDEISQLITRFGMYPIKPKGVLRNRAS